MDNNSPVIIHKIPLSTRVTLFLITAIVPSIMIKNKKPPFFPSLDSVDIPLGLDETKANLKRITSRQETIRNLMHSIAESYLMTDITLKTTLQ